MQAPAPKVTKPQQPPVTRPANAPKLVVPFPCRMVLEHPPVDLRGMFRLSSAFDMYEVRGVAGENAGQARKNITVDVLELTPATTTILVTPGQPMAYEALAAEVEALVQGVAARHLEGKVKVTKLEWLIDKTGLASDLRGRLKLVQ